MENEPPHLLPLRIFVWKVMRNLLFGMAATLFSLLVGMIGYHHFEKMSWIDAYVNAAMILSGMGPVSTLETDEGKIFAGTYALFSGIFFLVIIAVIFAPIIHRFFRKVHLEDSKK
jgi:hypothetical protein